MHLDARNLENDTSIEGDICIIGAGAAGISIALDWINSNYEVILLEGGGFEYNEEVQELYDGKTTGQNYFPLQSSRLHCFGGTTSLWAGMCSPFDEIDFIERNWVPDSGWPFPKAELVPYYIRAQEKLNLGDFKYDLEYWQKRFPDMNSLPLNEKVIYNKMWQHSRVNFRNQHYKKIINSTNVYLMTYANVVDIKTNDSGSKIDSVVAKNHNKRIVHVKAKKFVLACGAMQNARILLSSNSRFSAGLGNNHDVVGRYFMEHIEIASAELHLFKPLNSSLYQINHGNTVANAELGVTKSEQTTNRILNGTTSMVSLDLARQIKPRIDTWKYKDPRKSAEFTSKHWSETAERVKRQKNDSQNNAFQLITRMEQAPNPNSRICLIPDKDSLGMPRINLNWELGALEKRSIRELNKIIGREIAHSGIGYLKLMDYLIDEGDNSFPKITTPGWHHMGTTRMSDDPKKGVVDANCKVYDICNLFIAGSSCFPTSGAPNPSLTLIALSIRLSDYIKLQMQ